MIPNMYKIAAEQLPCVFDVSARTVATQSLNIFGDHSDVMACRQTGFAMLVESSVQEVMDLSPVAHLAAIEGRVPFLNFFDGFRTSHEYQKIEKWDYADLKEMCNMKAVEEFRAKALNPEHPKMRGSHENGDVFSQHREACNSAYDDALPAVVEKYMNKVNEKLGTDYKLFNYYGAPDADRVMIAMGSVCDVADEVIDYLNAKGEKVGIVKVRLYRPWVSSALLKVLPKTAKKVAVLDRTKEPGSLGEPLYLDVAATLREAGLNDVVLTGGRYGLGSKDTPRPPSSLCSRSWRRISRRSASPSASPMMSPACLCLKSSPLPSPQQLAPRSASSGVWAATAPSVRTRTPSRSSATTRISMFRHTSSMTQEDRRRDHQPPAFRRQAHPQPLLHQSG